MIAGEGLGQGLCPDDVLFSHPMTCLTTDIHSIPRRLITVACRIVAQLQTGDVTVKAGRIGGEAARCPMQPVIRRKGFARVERKPTIFAGVPRHSKCLQTTLRQFQQILLQRGDAKGVAHRKIGIVAVFAHSVDDPLVIPLEKSAGHCAIVEGRVLKIAEDGRRVGNLHCLFMVRPQPVCNLLRVTRGAAVGIQPLAQRARIVIARCVRFMQRLSNAGLLSDPSHRAMRPPRKQQLRCCEQPRQTQGEDDGPSFIDFLPGDLPPCLLLIATWQGAYFPALYRESLLLDSWSAGAPTAWKRCGGRSRGI